MKLQQLHEDKSTMPDATTKPEHAVKHKSTKGPHGGGNEFFQCESDAEFEIVKPIKGHTQEANVEKQM